MIGEAEIIDPVSGNDVPPGSLPEEVRDDIDARLSEGEYVVPADVVRYFGVKFFEDLRSQAKMGLQQMDADGRIGGDPIPPEDSREIAELKAELSESGMYAGGLTDGGGLDIFIDDASRSPMVNGRMRARGATVNMAVGGLAVGNYGDVTKVDGIIQKLMTAANKDPALMQKLASKGIKINNTSADKKSAEMKQANKPQEPTDPVKMQEGGLMDTVPKTNPFLQKFSTVGGTAFEPMLDDFEDMSDEDKAALEAFTDPSGVIKEVFLVDAEGNRFTVAWNTAMPVPEGFTLEEIPEGFNATEPVYPAGTVINPAVQTERRTGDDGPSTPYVSTSGRTGSGSNPFSFLSSQSKKPEDMDGVELKETIDELNRKTNNATITSTVVSMLAKSNPVTAIMSLITTGSKIAAFNKKKKLKNDVIKRYDEVRKEAEKYGDAFYTDNFGFDVRNDKYLKDEKGTLKNEFDSLEKVFATNYARGKGEVSVSDRLFDSVFGGPNAFNFGRSEEYDILDALKEYKASPEYNVLAADPNAPVSPVATSTRESRPKSTVQEQISSVKEKTAKGRGIRAAAQEAKRIADETRKRQDAERQSRLGYDISGRSDKGKGYVDSFRNKPGYEVSSSGQSVYKLDDSGKRIGTVAGVTGAGGTFGSGSAYAKEQQDKINEAEDRYEQQRSDFFSNLFDKGGLVAKPAAKKQKKRKTQRRKGLGSRP